MNKATVIAICSTVVSAILIIGTFYSFHKGYICSAEIEPQSGKATLGACDTSSISPHQMKRIFAVIEDNVAPEYAKSILVNEKIVSLLIASQKEKLRHPDFLAELIAGTSNLKDDSFLDTINNKQLYATFRDKLIDDLELELDELDNLIESHIVNHPNPDLEELTSEFFNDRKLLRRLRTFAVGLGPFRPVAKQFFTTLPKENVQPKNCYVHVANIPNYTDRWVKVINNNNNRDIIARTRLAIPYNMSKTTDGLQRMHVNHDQAIRLGLAQRKYSTGDSTSVLVISSERASNEAKDCFAEISDSDAQQSTNS